MDDKELDEIACTAADAALTRALAHLDRYRGESRFTTWAAKFALLEAAVALRKLAWRETPPSSARRTPREPRPSELRATVSEVIGALPADQRHVFQALMVEGVPIDVLAEGMGTTRDDVYERLQTARGTLRERIADANQS